MNQNMLSSKLDIIALDGEEGYYIRIRLGQTAMICRLKMNCMVCHLICCNSNVVIILQTDPHFNALQTLQHVVDPVRQTVAPHRRPNRSTLSDVETPDPVAATFRQC